MNIKDKLSIFFEDFWESIKKIIKNLEDDHISESSAQCAYYIMLSFVPFVILFLTLLQYTNITADQLFNIISEMVPENMNGFVLGIVKEIYSKSIGTISISLIFTLYASAKGLYALIKGLHKIYNFSDSRKRSFIYLRFISLVKTLVFIIFIIVRISWNGFWKKYYRNFTRKIWCYAKL